MVNSYDMKKDGIHTQSYDDGQKWREETFKDGKRDGIETKWFENGQKGFEGKYKDGELISEIWYNEKDGSVRE